MDSSDNEQVPPEIRKFIFRYLDSIELVKLLRLLHDHPEKDWSVNEITAELRSAASSVEKRLRDLYHRRILRKDPASNGHKYIPYDSEIAGKVEKLCRYDEIFPYRIIDLIYSRREDAMREFANAFSFKKEAPHDP